MPKLKTITFKIDEELLKRLDSCAYLNGVTRSELIRRAIEFYLKFAEGEFLPPKPKIVRLYS